MSAPGLAALDDYRTPSRAGNWRTIGTSTTARRRQRRRLLPDETSTSTNRRTTSTTLINPRSGDFQLATNGDRNLAVDKPGVRRSRALLRQEFVRT